VTKPATTYGVLLIWENVEYATQDVLLKNCLTKSVIKMAHVIRKTVIMMWKSAISVLKAVESLMLKKKPAKMTYVKMRSAIKS
jgi:hypothetical protein